jgi:subtilisin family serine protease
MESRRGSGIAWKWWAVALIGIGAAASPAAFAQKPRIAGQTVVSPKIDPRLSARAQSQTPIKVFVVLTDQPQAGIFQQVEAANALSQQIAESQYQRVAGQPFSKLAEVSQAGAAVDAVVLQTRQQAFQAIEQAIGPEQDAMESRLAGWGATRILRYQGINMLAAEIPASAIALLEADPSVAEVFPVEVQYAQLATSVPTLGAPTFWTAGCSGQGQSVGVLDTGARTNHPAFAGKTLVPNVFLSTGSTDACFNDNASSAEDQNGHGTHVTGIVMSQGSTGWTNYQGVAKGVGTLYILKIGFDVSTSGTCGGGGRSYSTDVLSAIDWAVKNTPLKVLNYSFGGTASGDDDGFTRSIDQYADTYGLTIAIAAGNSGPGAQTVGSPGIAYNSITAANWVSRGTIASSSSRGPTSGGRYKPDLAAPGSAIYSANYKWDNSSGTGDDFVAMTGTSMASPHLAGSAAVVRSAGVSNPLAVKAVLINTTDNVGWAADRGWGYTNLTRAQQELNYATGSLVGSGFQLYKITSSGTASASVTWNRHISGSTSYFNNIDLYLFRADTGAQLASSASTLQDVEEVSATYTGDAVVKVDMATSSLSGVTSEPYGAAFSSPATSVSGPSLAPSCSLPASIPAGSQFTLSCTATNSGDLTAVAVTGQVQLPSGFSGTASVALGSVQAGQTSSAGNLNLTAPAAAGTYSLPVTVTSTSFGETFSGAASYTATVAGAPAAPVLTAPANGTTGVSQTPTLSWSASSGATSYDVYFGTASTPPLATNTATLSYSPGTLSAGTLYYWRVVAKNTGGSSSSATWSFTTLTPAPPAPVLLSPASGATGVSTTTSVSWSASSGATSYDVYFGTASTPPLATNIATISYSPGTLTAGTLYYWRVVAKNTTGSNSSATWSFTTLVAGPPAPVLVSPANGATGVSTTAAVVSWSASTGATSYDVYFGTASSPPLATNTVGTAYSPGTLSAGTVYYWRVVAKNAGGSNTSATWSFTTLVAGPPAPVLSGPANGATGVSATATVVSWGASTGATSYDVYFGTASTPPLATNTAGTTYSPGTLSAGTVYHWRVVAKNAGGSNTSATWSFTTQVGAPPAPVLSGPANGATGVSTTAAVVSWNASTGATSYDVYFGTVASPPLATNTAGTTYSPGTLSAGTLYYWRVVAKNAGGSNTSATWSFTTQVAAPPAPVLSGPANGATGVSAAPVLGWVASSGATSYDVYLGTASPPPLAANTAGTTYSAGTLSAGTTYYWYVVAKNAGGSSASSIWSFMTLVPPPAAPVLSAPANGAADVAPSLTLSWNAASGAISYGVYFGTSSPPPLVTSTTGTSYTPGVLAGGTLYYWQVVASNAGGSNGSATWSFTTQTAAPSLVSPVNGAIGVSATPTLAWSASTGAISYDVYFGTEAAPPLVTNTTGTSYTPGTLSPGALYFWRVVARDSGGASSSATWSFTTPGPTAPVTALRFVPVAPCRISDTRNPGGPFGGPSMGTRELRAIAIPQSGCGIPATAQAYSLNVTVVPRGRLSYLALWPSGEAQPPVSTLNSWDGIVVANAAIVPAGAGGAVNVFVTDPTDVIVDIDGYFDSTSGPNAYAFYPATPCRIADTRNPAGAFGGPSMAARERRDFALPSSGCGLPADAKAYSLNVTVLPDASLHYLAYLTTWPAGQARPVVSTLNSWTGKVVANAALVPAGTDGAISVFVTDPTQVILDTNGYFAAPGSAGALSFYPVAPCRVVDTRGTNGPFGGPEMAAKMARSFSIPAGGCGIPAAAAAYSMNVTVVPDGVLSFLTAWPAGATQPFVSTLNSFDGSVVANAAIVPAGAGGAVSVFVTNQTHVVLDINGYFAP